jgi:hypothetical protein
LLSTSVGIVQKLKIHRHSDWIKIIILGKRKKRIFVRSTPVYKDEEREVCQTTTETVCRIESHVKFETLYGTRCS